MAERSAAEAASPVTGTVVTAAGPGMRAVLHDLALPTFHRWAGRWGWDVRAVDLASDGAGADPAAQAAKWAKTRLLRQALHQHPFALWLDADVHRWPDRNSVLPAACRDGPSCRRPQGSVEASRWTVEAFEVSSPPGRLMDAVASLVPGTLRSTHSPLAHEEPACPTTTSSRTSIRTPVRTAPSAALRDCLCTWT